MEDFERAQSILIKPKWVCISVCVCKKKITFAKYEQIPRHQPGHNVNCGKMQNTLKINYLNYIPFICQISPQQKPGSLWKLNLKLIRYLGYKKNHKVESVHMWKIMCMHAFLAFVSLRVHKSLWFFVSPIVVAAE